MATTADYPQLKRGAELAVTQAFGDHALLARAGTILGPYENIGRLTWWLTRAATGGEILAPAPPGLQLQYVDARDLASFVLDAAIAGHGGPVNVVSRRGHATMSTLLEAYCLATGAAGTQLTWVDAEMILAAGIEPWTELPVWLPSDHEYAGMHAANVDRACALGLRCRPLQHTPSATPGRGCRGSAPRLPRAPTSHPPGWIPAVNAPCLISGTPERAERTPATRPRGPAR